MRRTLPILLIAVALMVGACSDDQEPRELRTLQPVEREVPINPDRDADAVERALADIDPCALLTPQAARAVGDDPSSRRNNAPHSCRIGDAWQTTVWVGRESDAAERFNMGRHDASGAVSYRSTTSVRDCSVSLPVSQGLAVEIDSYERKCKNSIAYAEAAADLLLNRPDEARYDDANAARFTACELLAPAVPAHEVVNGNHGSDLLDACTAEGKGEDSTRVRLFLDTSTSVTDDLGTKEVRGTTALVRRVDGECWLDWDLPTVRVTGDYVAVARIVTDTCQRAERLLPTVDAAARVAPPTPVAVDELVYPWREDVIEDVAPVGACAHVHDAQEAECTPAEPAGVPTDPMDLLEQGEADPNVLCAAVAATVHEHYGPHLQPATKLAWPQRADGARPTECAFGDPTHQIHLTISAHTGLPLRGESDQEIAGHRTRADRPSGPMPGATYVVALDDDGPGALNIRILVTPDRDKGNWQGIEIDPAPVEKSEAFVADLIQQLM